MGSGPAPMVNVAGLALGVAAGVGLERLSLARARRRPSTSVVIDDDLSEVRHHRIATADGGEVHVLEEGPEDGAPVVLLHGVTLRASVWHHQFVLSPPARVFAVDLRDHGESRSGDEGPSIEANATDLALLLQHFDLTAAVVIGHSMGGMVLGRFLADHAAVAGARVGAIGFVSSAGRVPTRVPAGLLAVAAGRLGALAAGQPGLARRLGRIPRSDLGEASVRATFGRPAHPDDVREVAASFDAMEPDAFLSIAPSLLGHDVLEALGSVDLPAGVIVGSRDALTPVRESKELADTLRHSTLEVVPEAGHQLMLERPDEVNALIADLVVRAGHASIVAGR